MMNMSRRIVEVFYRRREKSEDYFVRFDLKPNPLNYDGMDEVQAMVVRSDRISGNAVERVVLTSDPAEDFSTAEALADLARKAAELEGDSYLRDQKAPDSARLQVELNRTMLDRAGVLLSEAARERSVMVVSGAEMPAHKFPK